MKKLFTYIGRAVLFVIGVIVTAIVTALITGQPLSGLSKFQGISRTFISGTVPAWGFALVLMAATLLGSFVLMELWRRRKKIQIHFVPDGYNSGWSSSRRRKCTFESAGHSLTRALSNFENSQSLSKRDSARERGRELPGIRWKRKNSKPLHLNCP